MNDYHHKFYKLQCMCISKTLHASSLNTEVHIGSAGYVCLFNQAR